MCVCILVTDDIVIVIVVVVAASVVVLGIVSQLIGAFCHRLIKLISFSQACSLIKMHKYLSRVCESLYVSVCAREGVYQSVCYMIYFSPSCSLLVCAL